MHASVLVTIIRTAAELGLGAESLIRSEKPAYVSGFGVNGSGLLPPNYKLQRGRINQADVPVLAKGEEERSTLSTKM